MISRVLCSLLFVVCGIQIPERKRALLRTQKTAAPRLAAVSPFIYFRPSTAAALFSYSLGLVIAGNVILGYDMRIARCSSTPTGWIGIHGA